MKHINPYAKLLAVIMLIITTATLISACSVGEVFGETNEKSLEAKVGKAIKQYTKNLQEEDPNATIRHNTNFIIEHKGTLYWYTNTQSGEPFKIIAPVEEITESEKHYKETDQNRLKKIPKNISIYVLTDEEFATYQAQMAFGSYEQYAYTHYYPDFKQIKPGTLLIMKIGKKYYTIEYVLNSPKLIQVTDEHPGTPENTTKEPFEDKVLVRPHTIDDTDIYVPDDEVAARIIIESCLEVYDDNLRDKGIQNGTIFLVEVSKKYFQLLYTDGELTLKKVTDEHPGTPKNTLKELKINRASVSYEIEIYIPAETAPAECDALEAMRILNINLENYDGDDIEAVSYIVVVEKFGNQHIFNVGSYNQISHHPIYPSVIEDIEEENIKITKKKLLKEIADNITIYYEPRS